MKAIFLLLVLLQSKLTCFGYESFISKIKDHNAKIVFEILAEDDHLSSASFLNIKSIKIDNAKINSLDGFENFKLLKKLSLAHNFISDIVPLTNLKNLKELNIKHNLISHCSGLITSNSLEYLDLSNNQIKHTFICNCRNLCELDISNNQIDQIIASDNCNHLLEKLDISHNPLNTISDNPSLQALKIFKADFTLLSNLKPLLYCKNIEHLDLKHCCNLRSISCLFVKKNDETYKCLLPKLKSLIISEEFLDQESKKLLQNIYNGKIDQKITLNKMQTWHY